MAQVTKLSWPEASELETAKERFLDNNGKEWPRFGKEYKWWTDWLLKYLHTDNKNFFNACLICLETPKEWPKNKYYYIDRFLLMSQENINNILRWLADNMNIHYSLSSKQLYNDRIWPRTLRKHGCLNNDGSDASVTRCIRYVASLCIQMSIPDYQKEMIGKLAEEWATLEEFKSTRNNIYKADNKKLSDKILGAILNVNTATFQQPISIVQLHTFAYDKTARYTIGEFRFALENIFVIFKINQLRQRNSNFVSNTESSAKNATYSSGEKLIPETYWEEKEIKQYEDKEINHISGNQKQIIKIYKEHRKKLVELYNILAQSYKTNKKWFVIVLLNR